MVWPVGETVLGEVSYWNQQAGWGKLKRLKQDCTRRTELFVCVISSHHPITYLPPRSLFCRSACASNITMQCCIFWLWQAQHRTANGRTSTLAAQGRTRAARCQTRRKKERPTGKRSRGMLSPFASVLLSLTPLALSFSIYLCGAPMQQSRR